MTLIMMGRKGAKGGMEFAFENAMDAFVFYSQAKDTYREDDLVIAMVEEEKEKENE